jgi:hypothetical protein
MTTISVPKTAVAKPPRSVGSGARPVVQVFDAGSNTSLKPTRVAAAEMRPPIAQNRPPTTAAWKWSRRCGRSGRDDHEFDAGS